jgi:hypothetical protein
MGQSAGADSVYYLCCSPVANKLFRRAIIQSPASFTVTLAEATELAEEFADQAGAASASLKDMQAVSADKILETQTAGSFRIYPTTGPGWRLPPWNPLVPWCVTNGLAPPDPSPQGQFRWPADHVPGGWALPVAVVDGDFLEEMPLDALLHGVASHLEVIIGANREEDGYLPAPVTTLQHGFACCLGLRAERPDPGCCGTQIFRNDYEEVIVRMMWEIAGMPKIRNSSSDEVRAHIVRLVENYEEERLSDPFGLGPTGNASHASQCAELLLVQGEDREHVLEGKGKPEVRKLMLGAWASFVRTGDPNSDSNTRWEPYSDAGRAIAFWDGDHGFAPNGAEFMRKRKGLMSTAKLWEELWLVEPVRRDIVLRA